MTFKTSRECFVIKGLWLDPYTDRIITDPSDLDVDHVVPLKEAYLSGAMNWSLQKKRLYANFLENKDHLIAVHRGTNRSKGARDPAQWLPPNSEYRKVYVRIWVEIKKQWGLELDSEEKKVIQSLFGGI